MFGVSRATPSHKSGAACRLTGAIFAAVALLVMALAFGGEAQACPPGTKADSTRSLAHRITTAAAVRAHVAVATSHAVKTVMLGACCGGSHAGGSACQAACSSCAVALAVTDAVPLSPADAFAYGLSGQDGSPPVQAPPQFRPPRGMA